MKMRYKSDRYYTDNIAHSYEKYLSVEVTPGLRFAQSKRNLKFHIT